METLESIAKGTIWALLVCLLLTILFGCKSKAVATEAAVSVSVDTTKIEEDSTHVSVVKADSVHVFVVGEDWNDVSFVDSGGSVVLLADGTLKLLGVRHWSHRGNTFEERESMSIRNADSMNVHTSQSNGIAKRDSTDIKVPASPAITKGERLYSTIGKWACGVVLALIAVAVIYVKQK